MKTMEIYDPAMCCSSGVCGPGVDPELIRVSAVVHNLQKKQFQVSRYNLTSEPDAFVASPLVGQLLAEKGPQVLPIIIVDGKVVKEKNYPTNQEFVEWTGLTEEELVAKPRMRLDINTKSEH
ncbi:arsenite efflux transporter metallochaperone ArsD [Paenibacillus sp. LS1]|uniref:arsenite efflux transporter metallochaperone ArsD n=1 Tax=Paenibacillus sp. LS1 TaxID=2992120 RepID=UPI0022328664|nr:arsenite efflux transporter metallochaperone ArsD [Paenibacillus sp. LS1]MCW3794450.1 arsenite efflux transporter metallochaperone ArsD [Paenibacillus sp. LS1]